MKSEHQRVIRVKILALAIGDKVIVNVTGCTASEIEAEASRFCKARRVPCLFKQMAGGLEVTRIAAAEKLSLYPDIDALEVGQSKLFELSSVFHQKIRQAVAYRSAAGKVRFSCTRDGEFIRVTRLPMTSAEAVACGPIQSPAKATKYNLERLASSRELRFDVPRAEQSKLRLAVHRQIIKTGWTIRARLQDDGTMLVYRTDVPAAGDSAAGAVA